MNKATIKHPGFAIWRFARSYLKELRVWRLANEDAFWLEREHEVYRKYKRRFSELIKNGVPEVQRTTSSKVWICWLQGIENSPSLVQACYKSVCDWLPDKEIVVITNDNLPEYVKLPNYIVKKAEAGIIPLPQYSDLIRVSLLAEWGGTWMDSTVLLTGDTLPRYTMSLPLFCFKQLNLSNKDAQPIVSSNWYISAFAHSQIMCLTRELLFEYWKTSNRLDHYFVFHIFFALAAERYPNEWKAVPAFNNTTPHQLMFELGDEFSQCRWEQLLEATNIHKLTRHVEYSDGSFYQHVLNMYSLH